MQTAVIANELVAEAGEDGASAWLGARIDSCVHLVIHVDLGVEHALHIKVAGFILLRRIHRERH